jgi:hypothetical protein
MLELPRSFSNEARVPAGPPEAAIQPLRGAVCSIAHEDAMKHDSDHPNHTTSATLARIWVLVDIGRGVVMKFRSLDHAEYALRFFERSRPEEPFRLIQVLIPIASAAS